MLSAIELKSNVLSEKDFYSNTISEQIISSTIGSVLTALIATPFDVVKTRLQVQERSHTHKSEFHSALKKSSTEELYQNEKRGLCRKVNRTHLKGTLDAFIQIPKQEGIRSLWSGLVPTLIISVPSNVMYFTMYDQFRKKLILNTVLPIGYVPIVAGVSARMCTVTLVVPIEFLRTKVQSEKMKYSTAVSALCSLVKQRGLFSLWHGWVPTIYRDVAFSGIYWSIYEQLKKSNTEPKFKESFLYGFVAGIVSAIITLPLDVIKTIRQSELGDKFITIGLKSPSTWSLLVALYAKRGIKSLYAGILPRVLKVGPACAIMISSYETGKIYFKQKRNKGK
ncbi:hypothetical protein JTE90_021541 [Oedothorax gibbosus]|uniref:Solute carrier family 25 member 40 n=1 Tax=Oedothorax gibbosus TaxID=931172 RepID=A0AAV6VQX6_9ARAC|nr:hypothetical protein JTE90_021541 [Oedothorax gibbosus]